MRTIHYLLLIALVLLCSCNPKVKYFNDLKARYESGKIMYGHQDDLTYGHTWYAEFESDMTASDVKSVTGHYPAVLGLDLGEIELGGEFNLDSVKFSASRKAIQTHYERGGIITLSWHPRNPKTGGTAWDVSDPKTVASILEGGEYHSKFMSWLEIVNEFLDSLVDSKGKPIPIIFRPWHEHTGSWFWWGQDLCTTEEYIALWKLTYKVLNDNNIVWAYSPNYGYKDYFERYPGDDIIDILGYDGYCFEAEDNKEITAFYCSELKRELDFLCAAAQERGKIAALTETGFEGIPYPKWWTEGLLPGLKGHKLLYVLTWRNAWNRPSHYYAPYPGSPDEADFIEFVNSDIITLL